MLRLKRAVIIFGIFAVVMTFFLFIYSDKVCFDKFVQRAEIDQFSTDDLINTGGNHTKWIEDFFDQRKEFFEPSSIERYPSSSEEIDFVSLWANNAQISSESEKKNSYPDEFFDARKQFNLSAEGRYLYLNEPPPEKRSKQFKILIWKFGKMLERRHLYYFHQERHEPFANCSVDNCYLDYEESSAADADAVVVLLHRLNGTASLPTVTRPAGQRWVFLNDESPYNAFSQGHAKWTDLDGLFNWSMTFKAEADVPVPYGRVIPLASPVLLNGSLDFQSKFTALVPHAEKKRRDVLAAVLISNCGTDNDRLKYVKELQEHIKVDFYGHCSPDPELRSGCPGSYGDDCPKLEEYMFYLAFENSACDEYITEKTYCHAYRKGNIPVIMGNRAELLNILLPPNSYLNAYDFESPKALAERMLYINSTMETNYLEYQDWRRTLEVVNEHGYFSAPSLHYCRLCEALNYNDEKPKVYGLEELALFLNPIINCQKH